MTTLPGITVSIAFTTAPEDPDPQWEDVTQYVRATAPISITRGRQDEFSDVQPSRLSLTLDNRDGRFTPERSGSPYYPNVKKSRRIKVSATWGGVTYHRFTGYIDEWPVTWSDASASNAEVALTATSRFARLARGRELRSIIECEYLQDNPTAYYTFGDPEGTTRAGNTSTTAQPPMTAVRVGTGGGIFFGAATGPGTDDLTAATFTRANNNNGFYMRSIHDQDIVRGSDTSLLMECFFNTTTLDTELMAVRTDTRSPATRESILAITAAGKLQGVATANFGAFFISTTSAATVTDGATHHAALRETLSGGTVTLTLFLDGVSVGSSSSAGGWAGRNVLYAGGVAPLFNGVLAHVAVYSGTTEITSARILQHALSGRTGFSGERSDQRIARLARYAGVPASEVSVETGVSVSIVNQFTAGEQPIALMQDVAKTESGVLFDAGDGELTFHARSHRYNSASALTLSAGGAELDGDLQPKLDDQGMANDITAIRAGGISMRATDTASVTDYGVYRDDLQLLTTSDSEVNDAAYGNLEQRSTPLVRIPICAVNLHNASSAKKAAVLARELGDKITLANLPVQAPTTSMDCFIEGINEQITPVVHRIGFNLSPAPLAGVWQLDSATYSVLDSTTRLAY